MPKESPRINKGPCKVCGKDDSKEKFRKLTPNLLPKTIQRPAAQNLKVNLSLYDQLCHKNTIKIWNLRKNNATFYIL